MIMIMLMLGSVNQSIQSAAGLTDRPINPITTHTVRQQLNEQPGRVCSYMPNMALTPCHLEVRDIDGPAR